VIGITSAAEPTAEIRSMVETGNYTWDIGGSMSLSSINQLAAANLIEPHKLDDHPVIKTIPAQYRTPYAIGSDIYSTPRRSRKCRSPGKSSGMQSTSRDAAACANTRSTALNKR
jgi:putative spermidine/putrescine transport system substrate-binding protein